MGRMYLLLTCLCACAACVHAASPETEGPHQPIESASGTAPGAPGGRYHLVVVPGHPGSPFLLDSSTGCVWHQVQNQDTKRTAFVEVDVENLHWSWGSGAQQLLARRIDGSNLAAEQKRLLKEELHKTACGLSNVVLTPGLRPSSSPSPVAPAP